MAKQKNKEVKKASKELERMSMSYEERWLYDARKFREWDERSLKEYEMEEATKKGVEIGEKKGVEIGEKKSKLETAKKMLEEGIKIETIIKITGLSKEEIMDAK